MKLQLIRSATLRLHYGGYQLLIDPDFGPQFSRSSFTEKSLNPMVELPLPPDKILDGVELVIVSHLHRDHFDTVAHELVPKNLPLICQPGNEGAIREKGFEDVTPLEGTLNWHNISLTRTLGHHGTGEVETIMQNVMGLILQAENEPTIYWAGDTILCDEVRAAIAGFSPDIIITHSCGATWPDSSGERHLIVMDAAQTIEVCQLAPNAVVIAVHMDAFDHSTISRADLQAAAQAAGLDESRLLIPADGELLDELGKKPQEVY